jgi:hypothetical protein
MEGAARVTSLDALKDARVAFVKFKAEATAALIETEAELQRTLVWLRHDQANYWQRQVRVRQELLGRAKSDLYRKQVAQDAEVRASVDQKKAVERAKRDLALAEEKVEAVRRWIRVLDKELVLYKGECQGLSAMLEGTIPEGLKRLAGMIEALEAYLMVTDTGGPAVHRELDEGLGSVPEGATDDEHHGGPRPVAGRPEGTHDPLGTGEAQVGRPEDPRV